MSERIIAQVINKSGVGLSLVSFLIFLSLTQKVGNYGLLYVLRIWNKLTRNSFDAVCKIGREFNLKLVLMDCDTSPAISFHFVWECLHSVTHRNPSLLPSQPPKCWLLVEGQVVKISFPPSLIASHR